MNSQGRTGRWFWWSVTAYLLLLLTTQLLVSSHAVKLTDVAASAQGVFLHGQLWTLLTSALIVPHVLWLVAGVLVLAFAKAAWVFSGRLVWLTAATGHLAGTIANYWFIEDIAKLLPGHPMQAATDPDYGVSLLWGALAGAIGRAAWSRRHGSRREQAWLVASGLTFTGFLIYGFYNYEIQHLVSYLIGWLMASLVMSPTAQRLRIDHTPIRLAHRG